MAEILKPGNVHSVHAFKCRCKCIFTCTGKELYATMNENVAYVRCPECEGYNKDQDGIIVNEGDSLNDIIKRLTFNKINNVSNL